MPQSDFLSLTPNVNSAPKRAHWLHSGRVGHKPGAEHCNWWHWSNYCKELKRVTSWISWCQILRQQQEGRSPKLPAQILMLELCFSLCSKGCDCSSYWQLADLSVCSSLSLSLWLKTPIQSEGRGLSSGKLFITLKSLSPRQASALVFPNISTGSKRLQATWSDQSKLPKSPLIVYGVCAD